MNSKHKKLFQKFDKNLLNALKYLERQNRYRSDTEINKLYGSNNNSRWYTAIKRPYATHNIKIETIIKLAETFDMSPGEFIDFVIYRSQSRQKKK